MRVRLKIAALLAVTLVLAAALAIPALAEDGADGADAAEAGFAAQELDELEFDAQAAASWKRLSGANRFDTMAAIVRAGSFKKGGTAVLVTADKFADGLTASGLAGLAGASYEPLAGEWPVFQGSTAPVKALLLWGEPQLYSGHTGIFWAPTGESTVPLHCATADMPFTMCHEAAHRLGIASEQEANFCAFLACVTSDDVRFAYSGSYSAFCYCLNALYRADPDRAQQVVQSVADSGLYEGVALVLADRAATREHYQAYEGPFEEVGTTVNNTYLRSFGESAGVRSYGLVVDYLIAWYETAGRV